MPIKIDFISNVRDFLKGTKDTEAALDDVADALDDMVKHGDTAERELEANFRDIARDAKKHGDDAGDNLEKGLKKGTDDFKSEAHSSGKEAAASFSGGFDDVTGFLQETAANAFEGFGPAGAAAGAAAAVGIGLLTAAFQAAEDKRLALEQKANDLATAYIDAGTTVLDTLALSDRIAEIATSDDQGDKDNVRDLTNALGDRALALRVLAGDITALATAQGILKSKRDELGDANFITQSGKRKSKLGEEKEAVEDLARILGEQATVQEDAAQKARDHSDALKGMINDAEGATVEVDELGNQLITLPDGVPILIEADTGQATTDVSKFKGDVDQKTQPVTQKIKIVPDTSAYDNWRPPMKEATVKLKPGTDPYLGKTLVWQ